MKKIQKAYIDLIDHALAEGYTLRVDDYTGDEDDIIDCGTDRQLAIDSIEAVEEAVLLIYTPEGDFTSWALIIPYNSQPEETLADFGVNPWMDDWFDDYYQRTQESYQ